MNDTQPISLDYRSSMQQAALAYLARHQAEHLADGDQLFKNCIRHLIVALEVPSGIAMKLVQLAWTEHHAASGLDHPTSL
ncbi:hypothetical protein ACEI36_07355 [Pseudomonas kielensis]|uniref:hypothetical protein n=1 Tax=Pseudomonas kielensis TaxID=2762577 RepID=UPI0038A609EA